MVDSPAMELEMRGIERPAPAPFTRNGEADLLNSPIRVTMGGAGESGETREYGVRELPIRKNHEWQKRFETEILSLIEMEKNSSPSDNISQVIVKTPERMREMLFSYAPKIEKDRDWVLDNATDNQLVDALKEVMRLSLPFVYRMRELFKGLNPAS